MTVGVRGAIRQVRWGSRHASTHWPRSSGWRTDTGVTCEGTPGGAGPSGRRLRAPGIQASVRVGRFTRPGASGYKGLNRQYPLRPTGSDFLRPETGASMTRFLGSTGPDIRVQTGYGLGLRRLVILERHGATKGAASSPWGENSPTPACRADSSAPAYTTSPNTAGTMGSGKPARCAAATKAGC